jgi:hypothetical protein
LSSKTKKYEWLVQAQVGKQSDINVPFFILALLVPPDINDKFTAWFEQGKENPNFAWPGFVLSDLLRDGAIQVSNIVPVVRK